MNELQLILTQPCTELWEEMPGGTKERHCDRCQKNIVDLTNKSDAELIQFFYNKKDDTCARLHSHQLHRTLVPPLPSKLSWQWLVPFAIGATMVSPVQAQTLKPVVTQIGQKQHSNAVVTTSKRTTRVSNRIVSGTVIDQTTSKPLIGVQIRQKGFQNVVGVTDSVGRFKVVVPRENLEDLFVFGSLGFATFETPLKEDMVVKLAPNQVMLGGISVISIEKKPMYLITAGNKECTIDAAKFAEIQTEWIEDIQLQKNDEMTALYGSKAANGLVIIEIKEAYVNRFEFSKDKSKEK